MSCRWNGKHQPRTLVGRHGEDCPGETVTDEEGGPERIEGCDGCQRCPGPHCRVCQIHHVTGTDTCGDCLDEVRTNLAEIEAKCAGLLTEATHRGVEGEAMALLGPVANAEARQHWEASVFAGRITPMECDARELVDVVRWLETADDERHPLLVIGTWSMTYRDAFEHDEPSGRVELGNELGYLSRNLTYMAGFEWVPFEDFANDVRVCVAHLEDVLGDSSRGERTNIDCLDCGGTLERVLGKEGFEDVATCRDCKRRFTKPEYSLAVKRTYIGNALWLSDGDMAIRTGVKAETVRSWARTPKQGEDAAVRKQVQDGRTVYCVEDVEATAKAKGLAPCA
jgi:hypothetical protein